MPVENLGQQNCKALKLVKMQYTNEQVIVDYFYVIHKLYGSFIT